MVPATPMKKPFLSSLLSLAAVGALGASVFVACSSTTTAAAQDPKPVLAAITENVILPTYASLDRDAEALRVAATAFSASPTAESLATVQEAWRKARYSWKQGDAFRFGPPDVDAIATDIDFWPASPDQIAKVLGDTYEITPAKVDELGASVKGFMGLEYLLFDSQAGNAAVLASFTTAPDAARRRALVSALASTLRDRAGKLYALWAPDKGNFAKDFSQGTGMFATRKAAADRLGNQLVFASISIESVRIGKPLGKKNGGTVDPKLEETPRSDNSLRDLQASLSSIDAAYRGARDKDGQGLDDLVRAKSTQLDADIVRDLAAAKASLEAVPPPLRTALVSATPKVEEAWTKNRTLKSTLSTELISALGATLTFSDADGD